MNYRNLISKSILPVSIVDNYFRPGIRFLMYHRVNSTTEYDQLTVTPELFNNQMKYITENYNIISLSSAVNDLKKNRNLENKMVITFDDGYLDNLLNAVPILDKYNLPATIFVTTEFCEQKISHPRYKGCFDRLHLDWDEVNELNSKSNITIGSHTISHPYLSRLEDKISSFEIQESKEIIQSKINTAVDYFCYPSGDYGQRELNFIRKAGYMAAVTVAPGVNRKNTSNIELRRTEITQKDSVLAISDKCKGAFDVIHNLLHMKRRLKFKKAAYKQLK